MVGRRVGGLRLCVLVESSTHPFVKYGDLQRLPGVVNNVRSVRVNRVVVAGWGVLTAIFGYDKGRVDFDCLWGLYFLIVVSASFHGAQPAGMCGTVQSFVMLLPHCNQLFQFLGSNCFFCTHSCLRDTRMCRSGVGALVVLQCFVSGHKSGLGTRFDV